MSRTYAHAPRHVLLARGADEETAQRTRDPARWERDFWYRPERAQWRRYAVSAAAEFNASGQLEDHADEPATMSSPRGAWGGGWAN